MRGNGAREARIGAHIVGTGHLRRRHQRLHAGGRWIAGVGAGIGQNVGCERDEPSVDIESAFEPHVLIAAVEAGDQILAPVFAPGDRAAHPPRQPNQNRIFGRQRHFLSEAAADIGRDDTQIGFGKLKNVGDRGAQQMRHLRRAGERRAAGRRIEGRMRGAGFERGGILPARAQHHAQAAMRGRHRGGEVRRLDTAFDQNIGRDVGVDERGAGSERRLRIHHRGRFFDLDLDALGEVLRFGARTCNDGGDRLAGKTHHLGCEQRLLDRPIVELVQHRPDRPRAGKVLRAEQISVVRGVDGDDAARGHGAAHKAHPMRGRLIGGEAALTPH